MKVRRVARVVVVNPAGAVLLVRYEDAAPIDPSAPQRVVYWVPPGGGLDEGESFEQAARREVEEETGIELVKLGPPIWHRELPLVHRGQTKLQQERYFVAWAQPTRPPRNRTSETIEEIRWWTVAEMRASTETFLPDGFLELVAPVVAGDVPLAPIQIA